MANAYRYEVVVEFKHAGTVKQAKKVLAQLDNVLKEFLNENHHNNDALEGYDIVGPRLAPDFDLYGPYGIEAEKNAVEGKKR
jgi:hypothetical protein